MDMPMKHRFIPPCWPHLHQKKIPLACEDLKESPNFKVKQNVNLPGIRGEIGLVEILQLVLHKLQNPGSWKAWPFHCFTNAVWGAGGGSLLLAMQCMNGGAGVRAGSKAQVGRPRAEGKTKKDKASSLH